ncbi:MAG TPA: thioesterase family protein [Kofleriaceae bacterium]|jgi:predicted thioesterase|nr:thioesterase family protein [Kofleriaceae bacterium]
MKSTLQVGLTSTERFTVDEARCISFMGKEGMVYATPRMVLDVEHACRDLLLEHLDDGEDSVGAHVSIDHLAATPPGLEVTIELRITDIEKRRVTFEFSVRDPIEECGRGKHVRFVADKARSFERIKAKRAKAGL